MSEAGHRFDGLAESVSSRTFVSTIRNEAAFEAGTEILRRFRRDFLDSGASLSDSTTNPEHFSNRIYGASMFTLPFVAESIDNRRLTVLEVGSGEGSYSAVLSHAFDHYVGVELGEAAVRKADRFCRAMGRRNTSFVHDNGANLERFLATGGTRYDVIIFQAVIEHMLPEERFAAIGAAWEHLSEGGYLIIGETPNTIYPFDLHSTHLWYFNQMQLDLWPEFFGESPHEQWRKPLQAARQANRFREQAYRTGVPVNFREFKRWFGLNSIHKLRRHIVNDNYHPMYMNKINYEVFDFLKLCEIRQIQKNSYKPKTNLPDMFSRGYFDVVLHKAPLVNIPGDWVAMALGADLANSSDFARPHGAVISPERVCQVDLPPSLAADAQIDVMLQVVRPADAGTLSVETQDGSQIFERDLPTAMREVAGFRWRMTFRLPELSRRAFPLVLRASRSDVIVSYVFMRGAAPSEAA